MSKKHSGGRPRFSSVFFSVNTFSAEVDRQARRKLAKDLVHHVDEPHDDEVFHRVVRQIPEVFKNTPVSLVHPKTKLPLNHALCLAMSCGLWPATQHEAVSALKGATQEQIRMLFSQAEEMVRSRGLSSSSASVLSVACVGSYVSGQTGQLIPVYRVDRNFGLSEHFQLRKIDFHAPLWPAMMIPLIERSTLVTKAS